MPTDISNPFGMRFVKRWKRHWSYLLFLLLGIDFGVDAGVALRLYYGDISGGPVSELTAHSSFPERPTSAEVVSEALEILTESRDSFGTWTRGYIEPPQTGDYHFLVAGDDSCQFWLSTSHRPNERRMIAENTAYVNPRDYYAQSSQRSASVSLVKGQQYYFELFHKDHIGYDHASVGWQLPDGTVEAPIPVRHLMPFPVDDGYRAREKAPTILKEYYGYAVPTLTNVVAMEGNPVTFSVTVEATPPIVFQWYRNRQPISGANLSSYTVPKVVLENNTDLFSVSVSNHLGKTKAEAVLSVVQDLIPPTVVSSLILPDSDSLAVFFSEPVDPDTSTDPTNYLIDGVSITEATRTADPRMIRLKTTSVSERWHRLEVRNVKDQASPPNTINVGSSFAIEPGLRTWLTFEKNTPTNTIDLSGVGRVAEFSGDPEPVKVEKGGYIKFDGTDDFLVLPKGMSDFVAGMTVALWARPGAVKSRAKFIDFGNGPDERGIVFGRLEESNNLFFYVPDGTLIIANGIELNTWQHFAASVEANGSVSIYKNGSLLIKGATSLPSVKIRNNNFIGRSNSPGDNLYEGDMDDVRIYARSLTAAEIKVLAQEGGQR